MGSCDDEGMTDEQIRATVGAMRLSAKSEAAMLARALQREAGAMFVVSAHWRKANGIVLNGGLFAAWKAQVGA